MFGQNEANIFTKYVMLHFRYALLEEARLLLLRVE